MVKYFLFLFMLSLSLLASAQEYHNPCGNHFVQGEKAEYLRCMEANFDILSDTHKKWQIDGAINKKTKQIEAAIMVEAAEPIYIGNSFRKKHAILQIECAGNYLTMAVEFKEDDVFFPVGGEKKMTFSTKNGDYNEVTIKGVERNEEAKFFTHVYKRLIFPGTTQGLEWCSAQSKNGPDWCSLEKKSAVRFIQYRMLGQRNFFIFPTISGEDFMFEKVLLQFPIDGIEKAMEPINLACGVDKLFLPSS